MTHLTAQAHLLYDNDAAEVQHLLRNHIFTQTVAEWGDRRGRPVSLVHRHEGTLIGAACGNVSQGWLNFELLWVEAAHRKQGVGTALLKGLEAEAARLGAHSAYLWTQEFEAPEFYRRYGYEEFVRLAEFGPSHCLIGMRKQFAKAA